MNARKVGGPANLILVARFAASTTECQLGCRHPLHLTRYTATVLWLFEGTCLHGQHIVTQ